MSKLPLKYQGVTEGEWRQCCNGDCTCKFIWSGNGTDTVATARPVACIHGEWGDDKDMVYGEVPEEQVNANATLMADSKRLAGAVVQLREALESLVEATGSTNGVAIKAMADTAEWAA